MGDILAWRVQLIGYPATLTLLPVLFHPQKKYKSPCKITLAQHIVIALHTQSVPLANNVGRQRATLNLTNADRDNSKENAVTSTITRHSNTIKKQSTKVAIFPPDTRQVKQPAEVTVGKMNLDIKRDVTKQALKTVSDKPVSSKGRMINTESSVNSKLFTGQVCKGKDNKPNRRINSASTSGHKLDKEPVSKTKENKLLKKRKSDLTNDNITTTHRSKKYISNNKIIIIVLSLIAIFLIAIVGLLLKSTDSSYSNANAPSGFEFDIDIDEPVKEGNATKRKSKEAPLKLNKTNTEMDVSKKKGVKKRSEKKQAAIRKKVKIEEARKKTEKEAAKKKMAEQKTEEKKVEAKKENSSDDYKKPSRNLDDCKRGDPCRSWQVPIDNY